jgi:hypothetical protein
MSAPDLHSLKKGRRQLPNTALRAAGVKTAAWEGPSEARSLDAGEHGAMIERRRPVQV